MTLTRPAAETFWVLDAVPEAVFVLDADARIVFANQFAYELFGYQADALSGEEFVRLLAPRPGDVRGLRRRIRTVATGGPARGPGVELPGAHAAGGEFPVRVRLSAAAFADTCWAVATVSELTDGTQTESVQRLAAAVRFSNDAILTMNLDGIITSWNGGAERMYGYPPEEAIGQSVSMLMDSRRAHEMEETLVQVRRGDAIEPFETVRMTKDGRARDVSVTVSPLRDLHGIIVGASTVARDITEYKRADATLRALLESAPDAVVVVGSGGRMVLVNRQTEELFGYRREQLLGQEVEMLLPERMRALGARVADFAAPDTRQTGAALELCGLRADGSEFPVEMTFSPMQTPSGVLVYAAIRDITERKLTDEELRRSNRDLEQFAYVASHDLSEPLRVIAGFTDLLARRYEGRLDEDADRFIGFIVSGVERMQALIDDLLAYSRAGRGQLELENVDAAMIVQEVLWSLEPQLTAKHIAVKVDTLPCVHAEPAFLRQIFQNLVGNAVKFSDAEAPSVRVSAAREGDAWRFEVEDNGPGVDSRHAERVFEMFQRLHGREVAGSGMGLAIVKRLTERHGGRVEVRPARPRGSIFAFTVPDRARRA